MGNYFTIELALPNCIVTPVQTIKKIKECSHAFANSGNRFKLIRIMIDAKLNVFRVVLLCGTTKVYAPCQLIVSGTQMLNH